MGFFLVGEWEVIKLGVLVLGVSTYYSVLSKYPIKTILRILWRCGLFIRVSKSSYLPYL